METQSFTEYLHHELDARRMKNPRYSLRAFARSLNVSASYLSKLLSGNRQLNESSLTKLGTKLGLTDVDLSKYRSVSVRRFKVPEEKFPFAEVSHLHLEALSRWYCFAILELMAVPGFKRDSRWIARRMKISTGEAEEALTILGRLGYIRENSSGQLELSRPNNSTVGSIDTSEALRALQHDFLKLSAENLSLVGSEKRDHSGVTVAIPLRKVAKAKELIRKFRRSFAALMQDEKDFDEVYHLQISFFPLTDLKKEEMT